MTTSPLATRLRQEADILDWAGDRLWRESEEMLERATAAKRLAREYREQADDIDDAAHVADLAGTHVLPLRRLAG